MQLHSPSTFPRRPSPKETIPYSSAALRQDPERLRGIWEDCQSSRDQNAIYAYLNAVYGLVSWWAAEGREIDRARQALRLHRLTVFDREDPFAAIIRCTADPAKADKRTRSKWSRALRYAAAYKPKAEPLGQFIRRKGGINVCAGRFSGAWGEEAPVGRWAEPRLAAPTTSVFLRIAMSDESLSRDLYQGSSRSKELKGAPHQTEASHDQDRNHLSQCDANNGAGQAEV